MDSRDNAADPRSSSLSAVFSGSFYKAPLCRLAAYGSIGSFFVITFPAAKLLPYLKANVENVIVKKEFWRLPLSKLFFTDAKYLLLCIVLIFHFKKFEKRYGSRKFASYVLSVFMLTQMLELLLLYSSYKKELGLENLPNGPLSVIISLFIPFYKDIPRIVRASFLGIPISGKAIAYICGLQVASSSIESLGLSLIGLVAGALYRVNFLGMRKHILIPKFVSSLCSRLLSPIFGMAKPVFPRYYGATLELQRVEEEERREQAIIAASMQAHRRHQLGGHAGNGVLRHLFAARNGNDQHVAPPDEMVQTLTNMGFGRDRALEALRLCGNDLAQATNHLLASNN